MHNTTTRVSTTTTKTTSVIISDGQPRDIFARTSSKGLETRKKDYNSGFVCLTRGDVEAGCSIKIVDFHLCVSSYSAIFVYRMFTSGCFADTVVHSVKSLPNTSRIVSSHYCDLHFLEIAMSTLQAYCQDRNYQWKPLHATSRRCSIPSTPSLHLAASQ